MKTLTSVAAYGLVPVPVPCEGRACPDKDDQLPTHEDANAALLAWYRHLAAERMANDGGRPAENGPRHIPESRLMRTAQCTAPAA
jgi:hypothetical protein